MYHVREETPKLYDALQDFLQRQSTLFDLVTYTSEIYVYNYGQLKSAILSNTVFILPTNIHSKYIYGFLRIMSVVKLQN